MPIRGFVTGNRYRVAFSILMAVAGAFPAVPQKLSDQKKAVVQVIASHDVDQGGKKQPVVEAGTGFLIAPGDIILTASHVVTFREPSKADDKSSDSVFRFSDGVTARYSPRITVKLGDGREVNAVPITKLGLLQANRMRDYCALRLEQKLPGPPLELGDWQDIEDGDDLTVWGFPLGLPGPALIKASVAVKVTARVQIEGEKTADEVRTLVFQGPNNKGMSGGPVIHNRSGKVVGIVSTKLVGITNALEKVRDQIPPALRSGTLQLQGINPNRTLLDIINVLDNFLISGMGSAVSTDTVKAELFPIGASK